MGRNVNVDVISIDNYADIINDRTNTIDETLDVIKHLTESMKEFFDTPTANKVQEAMLEFINNIKIENKSLNAYGLRMKKANLVYKNKIALVNQSIGGSNG